MHRVLAFGVIVLLVPLAAACGLGSGRTLNAAVAPPAQGTPGEEVPALKVLPPAELRTVAESSGFKATARHEEVVALLDRLAAAAP
jgi:hypothetical protein